MVEVGYLIFAVVVDIIWQNRNNFIFQGLTFQPDDIVKHILSKVEVIDNSLQQFANLHCTGSNGRAQAEL